MELHQIRYFVAVSRLLNFTRAAEQCNVTQPALTKAIQKLELELGGDLVHRERQLTQLTELGKLVLPMLEGAVNSVDSARTLSREYQRKDNAPLRIGLTPCISASLLVAPLAEIARFVPGLRVEMIEDSTDRLVEMIFEGEIGAAITGDSNVFPDRIDHWILFEERFLVLAAQHSPLADLETVPPSALADATWLERSGCELCERLCDVCFPGKKPSVMHRGNHEDHLQHMVAAGLGILLASEHAPRLPSLVARKIEGDPLKQTVRLLVIAGRRYSPALDAFIKIARLRDWKAELRRGVTAFDSPHPTSKTDVRSRLPSKAGLST
jgi:DNA-binding transcriptional LysR family regulator